MRIYRGEGATDRQARRRRRLLDAGLEILGREGWRATTVTAVCERAQLTPRYFYESFPHRDALLVAIFDGIVEEITQKVLAARPADPEESLRATAAAFVRMSTEDPGKGRAAFVEAFGSEALMRRRFERMHWFAGRLAEQASSGRRLRKADMRHLRTACLIAAGGLIETMVAWLQDEIDSTPQQIIDDYTRVSAAGLAAALKTSR